MAITPDKVSAKLKATIPAEGFVSVEHKMTRRAVAAIATQDPDDDEGGAVFDTTINNGKFVTVSGPAGASAIVHVIGDMTLAARGPTDEAAPAPASFAGALRPTRARAKTAKPAIKGKAKRR